MIVAASRAAVGADALATSAAKGFRATDEAAVLAAAGLIAGTTFSAGANLAFLTAGDGLTVLADLAVRAATQEHTSGSFGTTEVVAAVV